MRPNKLLYLPGVATRAVEIVVIEPRKFSEALTAIQALRASKIVILKLSELESKQVQRVIDLVTGGTYAIDGYTKWVGEQTFLFTPRSISVSTVNNVQ